ncbi:hypothetical protein D3C81_2054840 [compost metagenome]
MPDSSPRVIVMYWAMSRSPCCVPAASRYELVARMASGTSKIRDIWSPTRRPPRARHRILSNFQPDSCTFSDSRAIRRW